MTDLVADASCSSAIILPKNTSTELAVELPSAKISVVLANTTMDSVSSAELATRCQMLTQPTNAKSAVELLTTPLGLQNATMEIHARLTLAMPQMEIARILPSALRPAADV